MQDPKPRTEKQRAASRANGRLSRGPRTPEGKAKSALNSLKHGFCAHPDSLTNLLLPDEDPAHFHTFYSELYSAYDPQTPWEALLVRRIILLSWRLERLWYATTLTTDQDREYKHYNHWSDPTPEPRRRSLAWAYRANMDSLSRLQSYEATLTRTLQRTEQQLLTLKRTPPPNTPSLPEPETATNQTPTPDSPPAQKPAKINASPTPPPSPHPQAQSALPPTVLPTKAPRPWLSRFWRH